MRGRGKGGKGRRLKGEESRGWGEESTCRCKKVTVEGGGKDAGRIEAETVEREEGGERGRGEERGRRGKEWEEGEDVLKKGSRV